MATVKDIALRAGVSLGTVSRVLNRNATVSAANVKKVLTAAKAVGYKIRPDKGALQLRTGNIGLVLLGLDRSLVSLPVIAQAVHSVQSALGQRGANTLMADLPTLDEIPQFLEQVAVDGLIVKGPLQGELPGPQNNALMARMRELPTVWILGRPKGAWSDHCGPDNMAIGRLAAEYLLKRGHTSVAYLNVRPFHTMFDERQASFEFHARALGAKVSTFVSPAPDHIQFPLPCASDQQGMDRLLEKVLRTKSPPTAVFVPSDTSAALLYRACSKQNLKVGKALDIISCNNEPSIIASLNPTLATIDVHAEVIGTRAVDQLYWRLAHPNDEHSANILIEPHLIPVP